MRYHVYSDINQTLKTNYHYDLDSIKQSIYNILTTRKGTRLFLADFGSNLEGYLFEPMDAVVEYMIYTEVIDAISRWEPRVLIDQSTSYVEQDPDYHVYTVYLVFQIVGLDDTRFEHVIGLSQ